MRVGMQWDGYQQRWMHQMHGSLDITQDQGVFNIRGQFEDNNSRGGERMTDVGEAGNSQQMPYNHVSAEDPQNENINKYHENYGSPQCEKSMNASGRTCERNHDDGSFGKGTKKHKCVSGGGKKRHGLESKVLDQAGWSVLNVDDWDPEGIEAPPSDKRVYDSGSHKENEQGRMSQSYNLHKFRGAMDNRRTPNYKKSIPCKYYMQTGLCKFGPACKFDHPTQEFTWFRKSSQRSDRPELGAGIKQFSTPGKLATKVQHEVKTTAPKKDSSIYERIETNTIVTIEDLESSGSSSKKIGKADENKSNEPESSDFSSVPYLTGDPSIAATCDMYIKAQDKEFPVNSSFITIHSKYLGKKIFEYKKNLNSSLPMVVFLPEESSADIQLLLEVLYNYRTKINTVKEAGSLLGLAQRYRISYPVAICEQWLCQEMHNMHIAGIHYHPKTPPSLVTKPRAEKSDWSLAKWLSIAEQLEMKELEQRCLYALRAVFLSEEMQHEAQKSAVVAELVDEYKVSSRSLAELAGLLGGWIRSSFAQSWGLKKSENGSSNSPDENCSTCRRLCYDDQPTFSCLSQDTMVGIMKEDEAVTMEMLKTMNLDGLGPMKPTK